MKFRVQTRLRPYRVSKNDKVYLTVFSIIKATRKMVKIFRVNFFIILEINQEKKNSVFIRTNSQWCSNIFPSPLSIFIVAFNPTAVIAVKHSTLAASGGGKTRLWRLELCVCIGQGNIIILPAWWIPEGSFFLT